MKKLIVVVMALITIFSASVSAYALTPAEWEIVDYISNISYANYNCCLVYHNTAKPTPDMVNISGAIGTQKTTYNVLYSMYETVTVKGANFAGNVILGGVFEWYEYGGYCWIKYDVDNSTNTYWVGNYQGKILYCDAPAEETSYTLSAIAGATGYCLTDRPAGTTGSDYLGDLRVTQDNLTTIHGVVDGLGSDADFYMVLRIVNGEYRYYIMCTYPNRTQYFVCNTSGQLFYALRDEVTDDGSTDSGSSFDATEVITAINSVYSAVNSMSSNLGSRLANILNATNGIGVSVENLAANVVTGFTGVQEQLSTLVSYFSELSGLFPVQEEITLLGSDARVAWDAADRITDVKLSGFTDDLVVKEHAGALVDESGYEKVTVSETEYTLYNDENGCRRVKAANEYSDTGTAVPSDTLFYFPFDKSLDSVVGDITLSYDGTPQWSTGVEGEAIFMNNTSPLTTELSSSIIVPNNSFTFSVWVNISSYPTNSVFDISFRVGDDLYCSISVDNLGKVFYRFVSTGYYGNFTKSISSVPLNVWSNLVFVYDGNTLFGFINGNLEVSLDYVFPNNISFSGNISLDASAGYTNSYFLLDEVIFVSGSALWTSSFNPNDSLFSSVAKDYFLPVNHNKFTLNFYDTTGEQVTDYRWNQYTVNSSRLPNGYTEVECVKSIGNQYFDTSFNPKGNTRVVMDYNLIDGGAHPCLFGTWTASNSGMFSVISLNKATIRYYYGSANFDSSVNLIGRHVIDANGGIISVDNVQALSVSNSSFTSSNPLCLLDFGTMENDTTWQAYAEIYSCQIYDNGTLVRDFVPCINPSGAVGLYDLVGAKFYGNAGTGSFTAGNAVSNGSGVGQLVGVVSSLNANAYPNGGEQDGYYYEYIGAVEDYPYFSQTLTPADVNGNVITMGRLEDDFSEIYRDVTTGLWMCHDPQTQTEIVLSSANQAILDDTIYIKQNYAMYSPDQITADAMQNLLPVDKPVYLDIPENAKITITYDHYSGWFRMMYLLMDKQTKLLSDLEIVNTTVNETIINVENTVIDITQDNDAYNIFYIEKSDGTTESVGNAAKDAVVVVGDLLSMFYRLVFDDALDNTDIIGDFESVYSTTNSGVNVW